MGLALDKLGQRQEAINCMLDVVCIYDPTPNASLAEATAARQLLKEWGF
jgi:hypothetical protein